MIDIVGSWFFLGCIVLFSLMIADYKSHNKNPEKGGEIDDRRNFFMMGSALMLGKIMNENVWVIVIIILLSILLSRLFSKVFMLGDGDVSALQWILAGIGFINFSLLFCFVVWFVFVGLLFFFLKLYVFKHRGHYPFFGVLFIVFVGFGLLFGLF